ncbi:MAG: glycosyltransferase [Bacillota bacterium]
MSATLSLCVIAKDEQTQIGCCLSSARPFVDQMVVVDTGSTDATTEIARMLGAEVYSVPWQDDFSLARNASLEHATGEWILFLDCDEELDPVTGSELRRALDDERYDGYWLRCSNTFNGSLTSFQAFRLFRNHPRHRFEMPVHEQILPSILRRSSANRIGQVPVHIIHHGYEEDQVVGKGKAQRNARLLHKAREQYGETAFIAFNLGAEAQRTGDHRLALDYYSRALARSDLNASYTPAMVCSMVQCLMHLNCHQQAVDLVAQYKRHYPDYTDLVYFAGLAHAELGQVEQALDCMNQCLALGAPPARYFSLQGIGNTWPRATIKQLVQGVIASATTLSHQGQLEQALADVALALEQLRKTPDEDDFLQLADTMWGLWQATKMNGTG